VATSKVDDFGRVLIPKPIRDRFGLEPGTRVKLVEEAGRIALEAEDDDAHLEVRDGILVHVAERVTGDVTNIIEKVREERIRQILGMDES